VFVDRVGQCADRPGGVGHAKTRFLCPVTTNAADITTLMAPRMDAVYIGSAPVTSLTKLNNHLNDLFKVAQ
jgi:multiple sugar transport system substrate-binding protein